MRGMNGVLALIVVGSLTQLIWLMGLSFLSMVVWMVLVHRYWRCPFCGEHLDRNLFASYCPRYGEELDYDQDLRGLL